MDDRYLDREPVAINAGLGGRVRQVRAELYGQNGGPMLAHALGLPYRAWHRHESGRPLPSDVLDHFVALTGVDRRWLITGQGARYLAR